MPRFRLRTSTTPAAPTVPALPGSATGRGPLLLVGAALVGASLGPALTMGSAAAVRPAAVTASVADTTATVRWQPPSTRVGATQYYTVTAYDRASGYFGIEHACGACTSVPWPALVLGHAYRFEVTATSSAGHTTEAAKSPYVVVSPEACAGSRVTCATVEGDRPGATTGRIPLGLLDTAVTARTDPTMLTRLGTTAWRYDANQPERGSIVRSMPDGTTSTAILFDAWRDAQARHPSRRCAVERTPANPWDDWAAYDAWVTSFVRAETAAGRAPTYWDLINEPSAAAFTSSPCTQSVTTDLVEQVIAHSYRDVKAATPDAKLMAPSIEYVDDATTLLGVGQPLLALAPFFAFSDAQGLRWDAIDYHELAANNSGNARSNYLGTPQAVSTHLVSVRQLMAGHPSVDGAAVFVNEIDGSGPYAGSRSDATEFNVVPGRAVGYLASLTSGGADGAGLSCWNDRTTYGPSDCFNGSLDGLLDPVTGQRRSIWYAYQRASCMVGHVTPYGSTNAALTGYASVDGSTLRVLLGRFDYRRDGAAVPVDLRLGVPASLGSTAAVTVQAIPSSLFDAAVLPPAQTFTAAVTDGLVHLSLPAFADNGAYAVVVRPQDAPLSACDQVR